MKDLNISNKEICLSVFPFDNLSEGGNLDVFCKSFQIDLITELSRFRQFRIIAHEATSAAQYSIRGSFYYNDEHLRINAQLINHITNHVAWADRFEGPRESLLAIQYDVLTKIVSSLQLQLNYDLLIQIRRKPPVNLTAYEHWLYGMEALKKGETEADEEARKHFQQAISIDPTYSLAYSGMSLSYFNEWSCQLWDRWDVCQVGAYEWAKKAIELDEQNYVAACVLGRIYLYEAQYDLAEYYLRRALALNGNDTDNLIQIASCFVFLGYIREAEELYKRVLRINPLHSSSYHHIAALIAFELGEYDKCIAHGTNATAPWVDFPALMSAAYFELGDMANMQKFWRTYLLGFQQKIAKTDRMDEAQALQWIINVSPYREKTNAMRFWEFIGGKRLTPADRTFLKAASRDQENYVRKENDRWEICFEGRSVYLTEVKGFYDLCTLLCNPEKQFHCSELAGGGITATSESVFDERARRSYQKRISELQEEIQWSEKNNDLQRSSSLQQEYDEIVDHLTSALGIGRKTRKAGDPLERVRSAVTWRIRNAIQKIEKANPSLGKHLSNSIRTGLFCSYNPDRPIHWRTLE